MFVVLKEKRFKTYNGQLVYVRNENLSHSLIFNTETNKEEGWVNSELLEDVDGILTISQHG